MKLLKINVLLSVGLALAPCSVLGAHTTIDLSVVRIAAIATVANLKTASDSAGSSAETGFKFANASEISTLSILAKVMATDTSLQDATIIAMRSALGARGQITALRRGRFFDDVQVYIATYRSLRDATTLANIQNRYDSAKAELLDSRLPETVEELVAVLEMLKN